MRVFGLWLSTPDVAKLESTKSLVAALRYRDPKIRVKAAEKLAWKDDREAVAGLIEALQDSDSSVCQAAVQALGRIGDGAAVEPLVRLLTQKPKELGTPICQALGRIEGQPAVDGLCLALSVDAAKLEAARQLGKLDDPETTEALQQALRKAAPEDGQFVVAAASALARLGDAGSADLIYEKVQQYSGPQQAKLALALGDLEDQRAVEYLCRALPNAGSDTDPIIEALGKLGAAEAVEVLSNTASAALKDDRATLRLVDTIVEALRRITSPQVVPALCRMFEESKTSGFAGSVQDKIVDALVLIGDVRAVDTLVKRPRQAG